MKFILNFKVKKTNFNKSLKIIDNLKFENI